MSPIHTPVLKLLLAAAGFTCVAIGIAGDADAISADVKSACKSDYLKYCSQHVVGSQELRQCMRKVGEDLSTPCLVALVKAGEVTKQEIEQYKAKQAGGSAKAEPNPAPPAARSAKPKGHVATLKQATKKRTDTAVARPKSGPRKSKSQPRVVAKPMAPATAGKRALPAQANRRPQVAGWASPSAGENEAPRYTHNLCRATTLAGQIEVFVCGLDEKCCYGALFNEKYCVPASKSCF